MAPLLFFKSLADETRLKISLLITREHELCICELTEALALSQPKISRHVALLRRDGLLQDRRAGKWVYYRLASTLSHWQLETLAHCLADVTPRLTQSQTSPDEKSLIAINGDFHMHECFNRLHTMGNRPNRQQNCCA